MSVLIVVDDLIFLSKIQQTAKLVGASVEVVEPRKLPTRITQASVHAIILDLNHRSGTAVEVLRALKSDPVAASIPVLGFISHVQTELATAARAAGCDQVLARSSFSAQLPDILKKLSGGRSEPLSQQNLS
jgi:CheY-like chemotaxis protein